MLSLLVLVCIVVAAADGVEAAAMGEHGPSEFTAACIAGAAQRADDAVVAGAAASDGASIIAEDVRRARPTRGSHMWHGKRGKRSKVSKLTSARTGAGALRSRMPRVPQSPQRST